jgi:two-component system sensor histidine kinase/response regulator
MSDSTHTPPLPKVLVAEDDPFLAKIYTANLSKANIDVKIAANGDEVFQFIEEFHPDVILLDLIMPKQDGFQVLEKIKATEKWKDIPVVVTSNLGQQVDKAKADALGAVEYLVKSDISIQDIITTVRRYLHP